ncbi:GntR family transcriptional regulator, phosphonate transport system regulatory protein [Aliiroseovarius halocynthiae]|uniref:Phosphonate metabolism transcriptional regulator PhnF n=1 Tax=Aliiroseovarius halocynthiae TaxID=985055 RepID=A0A545SQY0_9RHOB|nr:phosphonate metabolism transcriptional regulator PhnF [Aliiroseovarius halocynthiae]TQV67378.1 phosphonate metabolism transcriptional regulator PhnF [Aliiroseovarius halocynthiae]SMR81305.1 GntR family transcriptional regulator, phosphonate transport system regulatory protein [Aliiroseovarius halocynthiae]
MVREKWRLVKNQLKQDIEAGVFKPGDRLPTEPELAAQFSAGRHSVRRAVLELSKEGSLSVEQGRGTFVEAAPLLEYAIGSRTRLRRNLEAQGVDISGELLSATQVKSSEKVAHALGLVPGALVIESRRITYADGVPIAFGASYHSAERFPDFAARRDVLGSTTQAYETYGIRDYVRAETTLHSRLARPDEAKLLKQHADSPVVVISALDELLDGTPLSYKKVIWSALRVKFSMSKDGI